MSIQEFYSDRIQVELDVTPPNWDAGIDLRRVLEATALARERLDCTGIFIGVSRVTLYSMPTKPCDIEDLEKMRVETMGVLLRVCEEPVLEGKGL